MHSVQTWREHPYFVHVQNYVIHRHGRVISCSLLWRPRYNCTFCDAVRDIVECCMCCGYTVVLTLKRFGKMSNRSHQTSSNEPGKASGSDPHDNRARLRWFVRAFPTLRLCSPGVESASVLFNRSDLLRPFRSSLLERRCVQGDEFSSPAALLRRLSVTQRSLIYRHCRDCETNIRVLHTS